jgi:predicted RNA-binding Zn ribbon-like protein
MSLGSLSLDFLALPLDDPEHLAGALVHLEVLTAEPPVGPEPLFDARRLQAALGACALAAVGRTPLEPHHVATLNSYAGDEPPALVLRVDGTAARVATDPVRAALAAIARDAVETIARHSGRLRRCEGAHCGRLFVDVSRGRRRRWCSMARCGNRVKVAAFRRRSP